MYMNKSIKEIHDALVSKDVTCESLISESIELSKKVQEKCNPFVTILDSAECSLVTDNLLSGIPYGVKDNYSTKGILSTGSSNTLSDYVPFFDATCVSKLKKSGAVFVNKTALDEFGMGGTGTTCATGIVRNPWNTLHMCGGSSAGSACAVAAGVYPYALASDTGDSIRKPAAFCGVVGYKPSYGLISRHGLFAFASSMDTCGVFSRCVEDAAIVVDCIKGIDPLDMTSYDSSSMSLVNNINDDIKNKKLCYIKELCDISNYSDASDVLKEHILNFHATVEILKNSGVVVEEVSVSQKLLDVISSVYVVISCAEATSNMSNLTGISFGPRSNEEKYTDMMRDFRTRGFSSLIKRRFVIGSYVLEHQNKDRYFHNAQRARRLIVDAWLDIFKNFDGVVLPVSSGPAPLLEGAVDVKSKKLSSLEEHLQVANFGGFPSITIPNGFINDMPVGINITCNCYKDDVLLNIANVLSKQMDYNNMIAKEFK